MRPEFARAATPNPAKPFVVVSPNGPNDDGDYGSNTPGTSTSGIQEAFDFLAGGSGGVLLFCPGVYNCSSGISINVPAAGNIDYIIQGAGPNSTRIKAPYLTNALTGWQQGAYAGRVAIRDIDFELSNSSHRTAS